MTQTDLQKRIMRRVYAVWALRALASTFALKLYALVAFAIGMTYHVSFANVLHNLSGIGGFSAYYSFFSSAVVNTEAVSLLFLVGIVALGVWIIKDLSKQTTHRTATI